MKTIAGSIVLICCLIFSGASVDASWLIDRQRFHTSVHGQLSCRNCHEEILTKQPHPDTADVNKGLKEFFRPEQCTDCHEDVWEKIAGGSHGGENITDRQDYRLCIDCHDPHYQASYSDAAGGQDRWHDSPELSDEERQCMRCHEFVSPEASRAAEKISQLCFHCHGEDAETDSAAKTIGPVRIDVGQYADTAHSDVACTVCHPQSVEFKHGDQAVADCRQCHAPHDAKVAHEVHLSVACGACHLKGVIPVKAPDSDLILWHKVQPLNGISDIHQMVISGDKATCRGCHFTGNAVGAASMVLPAKSILCISCHTATFSVGDTTTILSLIVFAIGILGMGPVLFSAGRHRDKGDIRTQKVVSGGRLGTAIKAFLLDGLLQRRLYRVSRQRWFVHAMVFFPFIFRFLWGLTALILSLWLPQHASSWVMIDKNHPATAFVFELSGLMILIGICIMVLRHVMSDDGKRPTGLPYPDWAALGLLSGILSVGFFLEGMRIAMTGNPAGSSWSFVGVLISRWLTSFELTGIYGYIWYLHAILTGAFVAYLPFSRLLHMFAAPLVLAMNAGAHHRPNPSQEHNKI